MERPTKRANNSATDTKAVHAVLFDVNIFMHCIIPFLNLRSVWNLCAVCSRLRAWLWPLPEMTLYRMAWEANHGKLGTVMSDHWRQTKQDVPLRVLKHYWENEFVNNDDMPMIYGIRVSIPYLRLVCTVHTNEFSRIFLLEQVMRGNSQKHFDDAFAILVPNGLAELNISNPYYLTAVAIAKGLPQAAARFIDLDTLEHFNWFMRQACRSKNTTSMEYGLQRWPTTGWLTPLYGWIHRDCDYGVDDHPLMDFSFPALRWTISALRRHGYALDFERLFSMVYRNSSDDEIIAWFRPLARSQFQRRCLADPTAQPLFDAAAYGLV